MGKYTLHNDPVIDKKIESHLDMIRTGVLKYIKPKALILAGSFGRGEGSVFFNQGKVQYYSDFEIALVSNSPLARFHVEKIERELLNKVPTPVSLFWVTPARINHNNFRNLSIGLTPPSIFMYELKAGSQIFYGNYDLAKNQIDPKNLLIWDAIRLLENRMMEVVEKWSQSISQEGLAFSVSKLILACGDALLIKKGLYHFSYSVRAERFINLCKNESKSVFGDAYLSLYKKASSIKLFPFIQYEPKTILKDFEYVRYICKIVLQTLITPNLSIEDFMNEDTRNYLPVGAVPVLYLSGINPGLDLLYENIITLLKCWQFRIKIKYYPFFRPPHRMSIPQLLYTAIPPLFFGVPINNLGDEQMLNLAAFWGNWAVTTGKGHLEKGAYIRTLVNSLCTLWNVIS